MTAKHPLQHLEIELLGDGIDGEFNDVNFGNRSPNRHRRTEMGDDEKLALRRRTLGIVAGAVVLIFGAIFASRSNTSPKVNAGVAVSFPPSTFAPSDPSETRGPGDFPAPTSSVLGSVSGGTPILSTDQPWSIYFNSFGSAYQLDVQTGDLTLVEADDAVNEISAVLSTPSGPKVIRPQQGDTYRYMTAFGPPGSYWAETGRGAELIDAASDEAIRTLTLASSDFNYVLGATPAGDPIVFGPDRRVWAVGPDDALSPFPRGYPVVLDRGGAAWYRCDEVGVCQVFAETAVGSQVLTTGVQVGSFSPDGSWMVTEAVSESSSPAAWTLLDMRTGESTPVDLPSSESGGYLGSPSTVYGWSPDGRFFTVGMSTGLATLDVQTRAVSQLEIAGVGGLLRVLAVF
jgi:hypothetical protein